MITLYLTHLYFDLCLSSVNGFGDVRLFTNAFFFYNLTRRDAMDSDSKDNVEFSLEGYRWRVGRETRDKEL